MPAHGTLTSRTTPRPYSSIVLRTALASLTAVIITLGASSVAYAQAFVICDTRPRGIESVMKGNALLTLVANAPHPTALLPIQRGVACSGTTQFLQTSAGTQSDPALFVTREVYRVLTSYNSQFNHSQPPLTITIRESEKPNAFVRNNAEIVVTRGLFRHLKHPADLAFVLAHEMTHAELKHSAQTTLADEITADTRALQMVSRAGFSPCEADKLVGRVLQASTRAPALYQDRLRAISNAVSSTCSRV